MPTKGFPHPTHGPNPRALSTGIHRLSSIPTSADRECPSLPVSSQSSSGTPRQWQQNQSRSFSTLARRRHRGLQHTQASQLAQYWNRLETKRKPKEVNSSDVQGPPKRWKFGRCTLRNPVLGGYPLFMFFLGPWHFVTCNGSSQKITSPKTEFSATMISAVKNDNERRPWARTGSQHKNGEASPIQNVIHGPPSPDRPSAAPFLRRCGSSRCRSPRAPSPRRPTLRLDKATRPAESAEQNFCRLCVQSTMYTQMNGFTNDVC